MARIAFATWKGQPCVTPDDQLAANELETLGCPVAGVAWDDPEVRWDGFDAVVIRSAWNYHLAIDEFRSWLGRMAETGTTLINPVKMLLWNADKRYLLDLRDSGVAIPETVLANSGSAADLILEEKGWQAAVVKPAISASAYRTMLVSRGDKRTLQTDPSGLLIQQFVPEIRDQGELSLMFFDGEFSHAVRKRPCAGEFRVQEEFGGTVAPERVDPEIVREAMRVLDKINERPVYARVDCVITHAGLRLMELELIEPFLYLAQGEGAPRRFAEAILRRLT